KQLRHPNITEVLGLFIFTWQEVPAIVVPWMEHNDLRAYIRCVYRGPTTESLLKWLTEIARGLAYLHDNGVYHGDLRAESKIHSLPSHMLKSLSKANILLDSQWVAKLTGFSLVEYSPFRQTRILHHGETGNVEVRTLVGARSLRSKNIW
ncbi:hypothetical protein K474DRAFT_1596441, partial [Panus rudis PR-1116 ss-1]